MLHFSHFPGPLFLLVIAIAANNTVPFRHNRETTGTGD